MSCPSNLGAIISAGLLTFCGVLIFWSDEAPASAQTFSASQELGEKICTVSDSGRWRDTITVPQSFTRASCESFRRQSEAAAYQLGCVFHDEVSLGEKGGLPPKRNCGW